METDVAHLTRAAERLQHADDWIMSIIGTTVAEAMGEAFDLERANALCERTEVEILDRFAPAAMARILLAIAETHAHYPECRCAESAAAHAAADAVLGVDRDRV